MTWRVVYRVAAWCDHHPTLITSATAVAAGILLAVVLGRAEGEFTRLLKATADLGEVR